MQTTSSTATCMKKEYHNNSIRFFVINMTVISLNTTGLQCYKNYDTLS